MPMKPEPLQQLAEAAAPTCRHEQLSLERAHEHADYLTGWYICAECGQRFYPR
jgi:hypothetical protein